ncbi:DUF1311 domain-containing protein [Leptolyngbya sp. FACHB-321]|uniref:lysozyme inhibitor LprI family protein n=1 Tax=Leptolyngbya sp. FACHB-321 TaxID=2692807 RepID=UPI001689412B|nr:lysozyme inhibitor LprI family protein [Leptolyngbya sp. FACHB-321]MBD2034805.1 DUF1311 domain-containing protein [Leptolyngbya sp. FACHB-321]
MSTSINRFGLYTALAGLASVTVLSQATQLAANTLLSAPWQSLFEGESLIAQQPDCNNPSTQTVMNLCTDLRYEAADRALNRAYQALMPNLSAMRRQKLTDAQLRWIKFRDMECTFVGSLVEGGSMQPMIVSGCKGHVTQQRTTDLKAYLSGRQRTSGVSYKIADRQLNQLYQKLRQGLEPDRKRKLATAQFAWIAFRDSACGFEASGGGNAARNQCLTRLTNQRNQQLQTYLTVDR